MTGQYELGDLSGVLGSNLYDTLFSSQGFSGLNDGYGGGSENNVWASEFGTNEGGSTQWSPIPNERAMNAFKDYSFNWTPTGGIGGSLDAFDPSGKSFGSYKQKDTDDFTKLMDMVAPAVASWGFGGALSPLFGGGALGGAMGHGLASGSMSSMQGGNFGSGFLSGAIGGGLNGMAAGTPAVMGNNPSAFVPAQSGTSIAGLTGVTNPTLAGMVNRGAGSALGSLAAGKSGSEILQSGLTGAALSGLNSAGKGAMDFYKNSLTEWLGGGNTQADYSTGSTSYGSNYMAPGQSALREAGLFPDRSNIPPSSSNFSDLNTIGLPSLESNPLMNASYGAGGYRPMGADILEQAGVRPGMSYAPPGSAGDMSSDFLSSFSGGPSVPDQRISSVQQSDFSLPSVFGDVGRSVGNFALNNAGDLASMLYGFYNNRKQQKALGQQISSLQGLYGQNSPYAQQLRNTLNAKAAASGRRSNVAGRETQFQAQLADRAASMAPTLMQLNQAQGGLKNNNMNMLLQGMNKLGGFNAISKGLGNLFGPSTTTIPYNNGNVSGSDMFGWKGSGGM